MKQQQKMASPSKKSTSSVKFIEGSAWMESVLAAIKDTPNIITKIEDFKNFKEQNPLALYGTKDFSFGGIPHSAFAKVMPKARKATLTLDYSIIYELSGRDPTVIKLYGVFSHADLGTGQPPNPKRTEKMAKKLVKSEAISH